MKNPTRILTIMFSLALLLAACNSSAKKEKGQVEAESEINMEPAVSETKTTTEYMVGSRVPSDLVCMVNDAYMAKPQIPVPVNGKTYYGCCEMCVGTLNNEESARMATDPQTGERVDKTEAFIVLLDANGRVGYFNSEANYTAYAKKS
jgi:YHS domain-containing protein